MNALIMLQLNVFQSTLPVGEATPKWIDTFGIDAISIHASRGGSDLCIAHEGFAIFKFQSTLPVGEATQSPHGYICPDCISIHASRGGSDFAPSRMVFSR